MSDLISRQAAIEVCEKYNGQGYIWTCILNDIRKIPSAQPEPDEWCTDCKEYDPEKHCCPRFNRVIRNALKDAQPEIIYCKDCQLRCEDYYTKNIHGTILYYCSQLAQMIEADFYCGYAERRTDE